VGQLKKLVLGAIAVVWCSVIALMLFEYRFFKAQAQQMMQLQGEYRTYIQTVKTVIDDYTKTKERLVLLEELIKGEKKNPELVSSAGIFNVPFPEGVRVYSSDDEELDTQDSFLVVNRELEYLKEATIAHIKEAELESLFKNVDLGDLQDYTERLLQRKEKQKQASGRKRLSAATSSHSQHIQAVPRSLHKRDMVFSWPIDRSRFWLSSFFGPRRKKNGTMGFHYGIDMAALKGTSVMAAAPGTVVEARYDAGYGNTIVLAHNGKYKTRYAHLDSIFVKVGQRVQRGSLIGTVGNTGYVRSAFGKDPSHLHFELYMFGKKVNPMHFLV
jgi:murein DD-endopeptidase MepM/ murein hydrolase activator NlpD